MVALHTTVNMVAVLAVVVAATVRGTKHCHSVADVTIPVLATLKAPTKVPATCNGKSEGPVTKNGSGHTPWRQSVQKKKQVPAVAGKPSFLSHLSLFSLL
jgi:hypothetical protein